MLIAFESGKMRVTHETGIVCEYTEADLLKHKQRLQAQLDNLSGQVVALNFDIEQIVLS